MLKAGALAKKKRREKQYLQQLTQQQLLQDRLVRDQLLEAAASREREFVRLSGEVVAGEAAEGQCLFPRCRLTIHNLGYRCLLHNPSCLPGLSVVNV